MSDKNSESFEGKNPIAMMKSGDIDWWIRFADSQKNKIDELLKARKQLNIELNDLKLDIFQWKCAFEDEVDKVEDLKQKLQAAEEKLTECASNYWKEVEKRKAAEEENKILIEAVEFYARKENWTRRGSQFRLADYGEDDGHSYRYGYLARQALEKVRKE